MSSLSSSSPAYALRIQDLNAFYSSNTYFRNSGASKNILKSNLLSPFYRVNNFQSLKVASSRIPFKGNKNTKRSSGCYSLSINSFENEGINSCSNDSDSSSSSFDQGSIVPFKGAVVFESSAVIPLQKLDQATCMGLVVQAALGTGWTTDSGLKGPSLNAEKSSNSNFLGRTLLSKSPRRRMAVEFTCNKCGERTRRAINPHAYKEGTVFVQCGGCDVFHKLVDNLGLFHEMKGPIFHAYGNKSSGIDQPHEPYDPFRSSLKDEFPF